MVYVVVTLVTKDAEETNSSLKVKACPWLTASASSKSSTARDGFSLAPIDII